jgi:catechol 2,3-dioxygenase-like lactoylglutathione lyase family enzyme
MKYVHTNIITDDWKRLAQFYIQAFSCKMTLPQCNLSGSWLARATGVYKAQIKGAHLRLPGWGNEGPTLEIFQYDKNEGQSTPLSNRKGFGHIAFEVEDVEAALGKAIAFGGQRYGEIAVHEIEQLGKLTVVYLRDPDGNIIELQNWGKSIEKPLEEQTKKVPAKHSTDDEPQPLDEETIPADTPPEKELPLPSPETKPVEPSAGVGGEDESPLPDPNLDKRAYLDALQKDLDSTRRAVNLSKAEIKASKESLKYNQQQLEQRLKFQTEELERERQLKKDKNELLQELKKEVTQEDLDQRALPNSEPPAKQPNPPTPSKTSHLLPAAQTPPKGQLQVELKVADGVQKLDVTALDLKVVPNELATRLLLYTTIAHPNNEQLSFIEYLGKQYRADLVPLVKSLQWTDNRSEQEKAWILVPRLEGSLQHLLEQCKKQPLALENLGLERLGSSVADFTATYQSLEQLVDAAQRKEATYLRLAYTANLAAL